MLSQPHVKEFSACGIESSPDRPNGREEIPELYNRGEDLRTLRVVAPVISEGAALNEKCSLDTSTLECAKGPDDMI